MQCLILRTAADYLKVNEEKNLNQEKIKILARVKYDQQQSKQ